LLVPVERLTTRLRRRAIRRGEVRTVRQRLADATPASEGDDERVLARRLLDLKLAMAEASGEVSACAGCATGQPWPRGGYAGGDCCSGTTAHLFSDAEVAALASTGTRPSDLHAPGDAPAGCAFRGSTGCSLEVAHRPSVCVRYACAGLQRELHRLGRLDEVERLARELGAALAAFTAANAARCDREWADGEVAAIAASLGVPP
jgi:hypothetical protein